MKILKDINLRCKIVVFWNIYQNEVNLWLKQKVLFSWGKKYYILLKLNKQIY